MPQAMDINRDTLTILTPPPLLLVLLGSTTSAMGDTGKATARGIDDLPEELVTQILENLLTRDIAAICLVSRHMNSIADPLLHKSILFDQPKHHLTFSESLIRRPRRGSLIINVRLEYPSSELSELELMRLDDNHNRVDRLSHAIATMSNLEDLVVSVPASLSRGIGTVFNGPFDLACLKSCEFCLDVAESVN